MYFDYVLLFCCWHLHFLAGEGDNLVWFWLILILANPLSHYVSVGFSGCQWISHITMNCWNPHTELEDMYRVWKCPKWAIILDTGFVPPHFAAGDLQAIPLMSTHTCTLFGNMKTVKIYINTDLETAIQNECLWKWPQLSIVNTGTGHCINKYLHQ